MKVLIGITSKNRVSILPKAIQSGLDQYYENKQVSVFDDASTDGTQSLVKNYPTVIWHLANETKGYLFARNLFLKTDGIDFYSSLDDDSWFLKNDALDIAIEYFKNHHDVAALAFDILSPDNKDEVVSDITPIETNMFIGCGHMLRVEAVNKAGGYTPNPGYYGGEEKDLCIRLINAGYKIIKLKGLYVWHDKTTIARDLPRQHRSGVCNDLVFMWRRTPFLYLAPALLIKIFKHIYFSIRYKKGMLLKPGLMGVMDFFLNLITFKIQRKAVSMRAFKVYMSYNR